MPVFTDQLGNTVDIPSSPQRIVSLVPSQTELLSVMGLEERVVGITKFCVHPEQWFRTKTRVGGTKTVKMDVIDGLKPDLIIANKEENNKDQVEELARHFPVWVSNVYNLESALDMFAQVDKITGVNDSASLLWHVQDQFAILKKLKSNLRTCYMIWRNPYMSVGGDTFIHDMLTHCGLRNIFADVKRYPEVTIEMLRSKNCELIILSSEPYPFKEEHVAELHEELPGTKVILADGQMFSWYGSRLVRAPRYFYQLLNHF